MKMGTELSAHPTLGRLRVIRNGVPRQNARRLTMAIDKEMGIRCPYYNDCAGKLEDLPDFDWNDPACFGKSEAEWHDCVIYRDLKNGYIEKIEILKQRSR